MSRQSQLNERIEDLIAALYYKEVDLQTLLVYARQADRKDLLRIIQAAQRHNMRAMDALRELRSKTEDRA